MDLKEIIDNLTIKQLRELRQLLNLELFDRTRPDAVKESTAPASPYVGRQVIVRTYSAGVHYGTLVSHNDQAVELASAKRIWRWFGANTLHEIALRGLGADSKVSEPVPTIALTQAIEIIPCSVEAAKILEGAKWAK